MFRKHSLPRENSVFVLELWVAFKWFLQQVKRGQVLFLSNCLQVLFFSVCRWHMKLAATSCPVEEDRISDFICFIHT